MFKTRLLTALILLPVFLFILFALPAQGFSLFFAILMLIGGWEYSKLVGLQPPLLRLLYLGVLVLTLGYLATNDGQNAVHQLSAGSSLNANHLNYFLIAWGIACIHLFSWKAPHPQNTVLSLLYSVLSIVLLAGAWYAISLLRFLEQGEWWVLALFFIVWAADVGAYLCGKQFGKTRLAPRISPGKTRAGLYGGIILAIVVGWLFIRLGPLEISAMPQYLLGVLGISLISVIGDLYVSLHKRNTEIKDSGNIFPGHGGILDRLDSTIATAPFYLALLTYLQ